MRFDQAMASVVNQQVNFGLPSEGTQMQLRFKEVRMNGMQMLMLALNQLTSRFPDPCMISV